MKLSTIVLISCTIVATVSHAFGQMAIVEHPEDKSLVVRTAPPFSSPTIYKLSDRVCYIISGTKLRVLSKQKLYNGEIWYEVTISPKEGGCFEDKETYGWVVGVLKNGFEVVKILAFKVHEEEDSDAAKTSSAKPVESGSPEPKKSESVVIEKPSDNTIGFEGNLESEQKAELDFWSLVIITLGTIVAVVLVQIEKTQSLSIKNLFTRIAIFRMIVISLMNIVFVTLFLDAFMNASLSSLIDIFFKVIGGNSLLGYFLLAFTISILVQRFITFTKE